MNDWYLDQLLNACVQAKAATPVQILHTPKLESLAEIKTAVYIIEEKGGNPTLTFEQYKRFRSSKQRACAKLNQPSQVMYVGSSSTGVKKRVEQHLGFGHKNTYALHLRHWFTGEYEITIKEYDVSNLVLQLIEDNLAANLKPAFGKTGGNNK